MSHQEPEFYRYCRSKGAAFGHGARSRKPIKAWTETKHFLDKFTVYKLTRTVKIEQRSTDHVFDQTLFTRLVNQFGDPVSSYEYSHHWEINTDYSDDLVSIALDHLKHKKKHDNTISVRMYFNFHWKVFNDCLIAKYSDIFDHFYNEGYHGKFSVTLSDHVFIQPEFVVPIETPEKLDHFVESLKEELPFNFKDKSFISFFLKTFKNGKTTYKAMGHYNKN